MTPWALLIGLLVLLAVAAWLSRTATRLDRMHHRIDVSRATLDAQLLRRSGVTLELSGCDDLDPASRLVLLDAAHRARNAGPREVEPAESDLSEALRAVFGEADALGSPLADHPGVAPLLAELAESCVRLRLARRFHNDAVASARALGSQRRVRWLRLAGGAGPLRTVDLDDVPPAALVADLAAG